MQKLMRAVYQEYQIVPKQVERITEQQYNVILKRRRFRIVCRSIGLSMFSCGMLIFYASKKEQEKYLCPWWDIRSSPPRLVTTGPYQYSRNPMYLSYLTMFTSVGIFFLNWILISIPCFGVTLLAYSFYNETYIVIEEDKLMRKFGEKYIIYRTITPKWIGLPRSITPQTGQQAYSV